MLAAPKRLRVRNQRGGPWRGALVDSPTSRGAHVELGVIDAQPASMDAKNESETIETMSLRMDESS